jgi:beta-N-acetylhexosaminidase
VPATDASFLDRAGRAWSSDAEVTARLTNAFAEGLEAESVIPTLKHFPGIGLAEKNTDRAVVTIDASAVELDRGLTPYRLGIAHDIPMIMLSNATYPTWDGANAAGWSAEIVDTLLRDRLGFRGVTISDSLDGTAHARGVRSRDLALLAARAGTDLILITGSESTSTSAYASLVAAARAGRLDAATLRASYDRIVALKSTR